MTIKAGIIGLGAIGGFLIDQINSDDRFDIVAVFDVDTERYKELFNKNPSPPPLLPVSEFPDDTNVFIECASVSAVVPVVEEAIRRGKVSIVASIGGILDNMYLLTMAQDSNAKILLPSGAIGGLDILKALDKDEILEITLTTRKNPNSLPDSDSDRDKEIEIFNGNAKDAIRRFPKNINVAALLSLAGIGSEKTIIKIISDPKVKLNTHEIFINAKCGNYRIICQNEPFADNLSSSMLAAKSIWASLKSLKENVILGL